jgi:hypothetical protein
MLLVAALVVDAHPASSGRLTIRFAAHEVQ